MKHMSLYNSSDSNKASSVDGNELEVQNVSMLMLLAALTGSNTKRSSANTDSYGKGGWINIEVALYVEKS